MPVSRPSVTVLLCTHNGERFLREQLDTILVQQDVDLRIAVLTLLSSAVALAIGAGVSIPGWSSELARTSFESLLLIALLLLLLMPLVAFFASAGRGYLPALGWALWRGDAGFEMRVFFLACVMVAGAFGAATASRKILWIQALPAALALAASLLARG